MLKKLTAPPQGFHIPSLDGMRALAILLVFISHAGWGHIVPGGLGVTVFFFLSGYLITTLLRREFDAQRGVDLKAFYIRRAFRIWPAFYLVLLAGMSLTLLGLLPGEVKLYPMLAQLLHATNYYFIMASDQGMPLGSGVFWSLAVEEHFYLVFPLLYLSMRRLGLTGVQQLCVLAVACVAILLWRLYLIQVAQVPSLRTYLASDTRFDSLLFGCALAVWKNPVLDKPTVGRKVYCLVVLPLALAALVLSLTVRSELFRESLRYSIQGLALYPIFVAAIRFPDLLIFRPLNRQPLRALGLLSYSFYLVHHTVLQATAYYLPHWAVPGQAVLGFAISLTLSCLIFVGVESRAAAIRHRVLSRRARPAAAAMPHTVSQ